jgi:hypothetical protein
LSAAKNTADILACSSCCFVGCVLVKKTVLQGRFAKTGAYRFLYPSRRVRRVNGLWGAIFGFCGLD